MELKALAVGNSTFENLRPQGYLYVDKTADLHKLVKQAGGRYFLSRPRRFGKSLTCSTLKAIFQGKKELFKGLAIYDTNYKWEKHPVLHFDFSQIDHRTPEQLESSLHDTLERMAKSFNVKFISKNLKQKMVELVIELHKQQDSVAVIIDEYDKAIVDHIDNLEVAEQMRTLLRDFFGSFKGQEIDSKLHFLFITGVSKFSKISLFSEVNNLNDISMDSNFAAIVGYTHEEVKHNLQNHIQIFAEQEKVGFDRMLEKLRFWYNGFRFSEAATTVYNPVSLHSCLTKHRFANYWFSTGTSNFLLKALAKNPQDAKRFIEQSSWIVAASELEAFSPEVYFKKINTLMLQTGYLTIKNIEAEGRTLGLDFPNFEVRSSITEQILDYVAQMPASDLIAFTERFKDALAADDIDAFCEAISDFYKSFPHDLVTDREKFYQAMFYSNCLMIGANVAAEVSTHQGYIDAVLHGPKNVYVIEFKKDKSPDAALKQISDKEYFAKFKITGKKPVVCVGITFKEFRNTVKVQWKHKRLAL